MTNYPLYPVDACADTAAYLATLRAKHADRIAFETVDTNWTYRQLTDSVAHCAAALADRQQQRLRIQTDHPFYFAVAFFAVLLSGNIAVLCDVPTAATLDEPTLLRLLNQTVSEPAAPACGDPNAPAVIVGSSGTTSVAKAVVLSQANLYSDMAAVMATLEYKQTARYLNVIPFSHLFGVVGAIMIPLYAGSTVCFGKSKYTFFEDLKRFRPTMLNLPPQLCSRLHQLIAAAGEADAVTGGRLEKIICGGAQADDSLNNLFAQYGIRMYATYGLTECAPCISVNRDRYYKIGSGGVVIPCCEVRIDNGEIAVRGSNVMLGYLDDPAATARVLRDGWLYTGDLGYLDDDGFLFVTGRKSNILVLSSGKKVIPEQVEAVLSRLPCVKECLVRACNDRGDVAAELVCVPNGSAAAAESQLRQALNRHGYDFIRRLTFTDSLPKSSLGKVLRTPRSTAEKTLADTE
ncbi:MAG: AMP-binding protein [Eubacterium sp.]|nr:AMP-binding protein [Eubacterium sp.]